MVVKGFSQLMQLCRVKVEAVKYISKTLKEVTEKQKILIMILQNNTPFKGSFTKEYKAKNSMNTAQVSLKSIFCQTKQATVLIEHFWTSLRLLQLCHMTFLISYNARFLIKRAHIRWIKNGLIGRYQWAGLFKASPLREIPGPTVFL